MPELHVSAILWAHKLRAKYNKAVKKLASQERPGEKKVFTAGAP